MATSAKMKLGRSPNVRFVQIIGPRYKRNILIPYFNDKIPFVARANYSYGLHKTSGHIGRFENGKRDFSTNLGRIPDRVGPLAPGSPWLPFAQ